MLNAVFNREHPTCPGLFARMEGTTVVSLWCGMPRGDRLRPLSAHCPSSPREEVKICTWAKAEGGGDPPEPLDDSNGVPY